MNTELTFWDQVSLAIALIFVLVFIINKIRQFITSPAGSCGGCSGSGCASSSDAQCPKSEQESQKITINEVEYIKLKPRT